jgi:hypothetical protein
MLKEIEVKGRIKMKEQKEMSEKELTEFWANYTPPNPELGQIFANALKLGIMENKKNEEEAKRLKGQPPCP